MPNEHFGRTDNQIFPRVVAIFDFDSRGSLRRAKREIIVCSRLQDTVEPQNNEGPRARLAKMFAIHHSHIGHNARCLPPKILHNLYL